jgi:hypothetical protein
VTKVRVGLVGTGVIAQVMHLHYLAELADRFDVAAVCDLDGEAARACAGRYGIPVACTDWRELLAHPLDAVMVLTSGSHAPIAEAAARARAARVRGEADVLLGRRGPGHGSRGRRGRGRPDDRLPETVRPGIRPDARGDGPAAGRPRGTGWSSRCTRRTAGSG